MHSNSTGRNEEIRHLQGCIRDLIRVQVALHGLGRMMENASVTAEPKHTEAAFQELQSELAHTARLTTMGELAASIAHEINQPLGAIVNNGNLCLRLLANRAEAPEIREALSDIVDDANRANAIVTRVRDMTKRTTSEKTALKPEGIVADVILLARHELEKYSIEVRTILTGTLPWVSGDLVQLQQVFLNLIMNSIEAMAGIAADQRVLTISGERAELNTESAVLVKVHDNGTGWLPGAEHRIFEAFYTTKPQGMGMGLCISRSIVEAHGGRIWAKSAGADGTTFFCLLPAATSKEP